MYYFTFNSFSLSTLCKDISPSILEGSDISLFCNWKPLIQYFLEKTFTPVIMVTATDTAITIIAIIFTPIILNSKSKRIGTNIPEQYIKAKFKGKP